MSTKSISALCTALLFGLLANLPALAQEDTATAKQAKESHGGVGFDSPPSAPAAAETAQPTAGAGEQTPDEQVEKAIDGTSFDAPPAAASAEAAEAGTAGDAPEEQVNKSIDGADF